MPTLGRRIILLCFLLTVPWAMSCGASHNRSVTLEYRVRIDPRDGILVDVTATGLRKTKAEFHLLNGLGLLQDQALHIEDLVAYAGDHEVSAVWDARGGLTVWSVDRGRDETVRLQYRVRGYDPERSPEASFVTGERGVVVGYSTFLVPAEITDYLPADIRVHVVAPDGWPIWGTWPGDGPVFAPATAHELWSGGAMTGDFTETALSAGPARIRVLTEGPTRTMGLSVANRLLPIIREMVGLFGTPPRDSELSVLALYRVIPLRDDRSLMAGASEERSFFCMATPDRFNDLEQLTALAAHECLHFYLGGALIGQAEPPFNNSPDLIWLIEGVTEYLTYRLMERAQIITAERFAGINKEKRRSVSDLGIAQGMSLASAARSLTDAETYQLVYSKGFLIAAYLDERMTADCGSNAFEGAIRELFEKHNFYSTHEWITPEIVRRVFEEACPGAAELIERFAEGNASVPAMFSSPAGTE